MSPHPPGVLRVEAGIAVGAVQEFRDGFGHNAERPQRRIELSERDKIAGCAAVDGRRFRQGHHAVYPRVGHVTAHDGQGRMHLLLRDDGIGKIGRIPEPHLHAWKLFPRLTKNIVHFLPRHGACVVALHVVGEPRLVPPSLGRSHAAPLPPPSVLRREPKQNARAVRALPPAKRRNFRHHGI